MLAYSKISVKGFAVCMDHSKQVIHTQTHTHGYTHPTYFSVKSVPTFQKGLVEAGWRGGGEEREERSESAHF